jgi:hypothetical protein
MSIVETLEPRTLFSATISQTLLSDWSNLTSDIMAGKVAFQEYGPTLQADLQTLRTDVKAVKQPAGVPLITKLNVASLRFLNTTRAETLNLFAVVARDALVGSVDSILLNRHPGNARVQAVVTASLTRFNTAATALLAKLGASGSTLSSNSASAAAALTGAYADSAAVVNDVTKLQSDGSAFLSSLGNTLSNVQTDFSLVMNDVLVGN